MNFGKRVGLAEEAEGWCRRAGAGSAAIHVVTALDAMGWLRDAPAGTFSMRTTYAQREGLAARSVAWLARRTRPGWTPRGVVEALDAMGYLKDPRDWPAPDPPPAPDRLLTD
jgi:hypothetical protein